MEVKSLVACTATMRSLAMLAFLLLAGCTAGPEFAPVPPLSTTPPSPPLLPLQMDECLTTEALLPIPESEPFPPGVTPAAGSQLGPLQMASFWAISCNALDGVEADRHTLLLGLFDVEVEAAFDGPGDEHWVVALTTDSSDLAGWFETAGIDIEAVTIVHDRQQALGARLTKIEAEGITIECSSAQPTGPVDGQRRLLFGDSEGLDGAVDLGAVFDAGSAGTSLLTFLETTPPFILPGTCTADTASTMAFAWTPIPAAPNP